MAVVKVLGGYLEVESGGIAGGEPPSIWPSPGHPAHPIAPGGPPPSIWPSPGHPAHPIVIPPDLIAPGVPAHPIYIPVYPAHPIVIPPDLIAPGVPAHPIVIPPVIWGPNDPRPTPPIVIPTPDGERNFALKAVWTQDGWVTVIVPVGDQPIPTPSETPGRRR